MNIPKDRKYTREHEWAKREGNAVRVGITDYAQSQLADIVYLELSPTNTYLEAMKTFGVIEAVKAASDLFAPVSGKIITVNQKVQQDPSTIHSDPYGDGWLIEIQMEKEDEWQQLLSPEEYQTLIEQKD